ncbi:MAG: septum formation initiator family protein [Bacteroidetes bacterium]|jgi:cell division protein FtsB|nr:septum formation initiator family protein [Bacteroidota bacterium]
MIRFKYNEKIPALFRNKYFLTILVFLIWIILLDSNNLLLRIREMRELNRLKTDKEYYTEKIKVDRSKLQELKTDDHNLEKFAREQYRMKKPDEDLFIVLTPKEDRKNTRENR